VQLDQLEPRGERALGRHCELARQRFDLADAERARRVVALAECERAGCNRLPAGHGAAAFPRPRGRGLAAGVCQLNASDRALLAHERRYGLQRVGVLL
jgi:hypothetical protein